MSSGYSSGSGSSQQGNRGYSGQRPYRNETFTNRGDGNRNRDWRDNQRGGGSSVRSSSGGQQQGTTQQGSKMMFSGAGLKSNTQGAPPQLAQGKLRIVPIGGQSELGRSSWYFEQDNEIILVDAGIGFVPHGFKGGVDFILPNLNYIKENKAKIKAIFITNPHEEYFGDVVNFVETLEIKEVYLPRILTFQLKGKFSPDVKVIPIESSIKYKVGTKFSIKAFNVGFVGVDSYSFLIETPTHRVFYTGPFKLDHNPPFIESQANIQEIAKSVTELGVDLLISCSSNAESTGYAASELSVQRKLDEILSEAKGRVITLISSSSTHRLKLLLELAKKRNRKVFLSGDTLKEWFKALVDGGYIDYDKNLFLEQSELNNGKVNNKEVLIIAGTLEGDVLEPFIELAYKNHPDTNLIEGDTLVVSANPPLGTSRILANAVDQLFLQGVHVIGGREAGVHVNGYAAQEELKFMYNITRPKYFLPSHGEARQLVLHAELLGRCGVDPQNIVIVDNGNVVDFDVPKNRVEVSGKVEAQPIFFNETLAKSLNNQSLEERRSLSEDGTLTLVVAVDFMNSQLKAGPYIQLYGNSFSRLPGWTEYQAAMKQDIVNSVEKALKAGQKDPGIIRHLIHDVLSKRIREKFGMSKPVLFIVVQEVSSN